MRHTNCSHPPTTLARRECRLRSYVDPTPTGGGRRFPEEPSANATPRWKPTNDKHKAVVIKLDGKPLTQDDCRKLPYVLATEVHQPLLRVIDPPGPWDGYGVIGRDASGNYVRTSDYGWESTHERFSELPLGRLADTKDYGRADSDF